MPAKPAPEYSAVLCAMYAWQNIIQASHCHVQVSIGRLLARHQAAAHPLLNAQARGSRASHAVEAAMHYITSSSLFAGRPRPALRVPARCTVRFCLWRRPSENHKDALLCTVSPWEVFVLPAHSLGPHTPCQHTVLQCLLAPNLNCMGSVYARRCFQCLPISNCTVLTRQHT